MELPKRYNEKLSFLKIPDAKEKAVKIFNALDGVEIDTAIALLEWCSRKLFEQRVDINSGFLQELGE